MPPAACSPLTIQICCAVASRADEPPHAALEFSLAPGAEEERGHSAFWPNPLLQLTAPGSRFGFPTFIHVGPRAW